MSASRRGRSRSASGCGASFSKRVLIGRSFLRPAGGRFGEGVGESGAQRCVHLRHRRGDAEPREGSYAVFGNTAGDDPAIMVELGIDIEREAVIGHPSPHAHSDRRDLFLTPARPRDPNSDAAVTTLPPDIESPERADDPLFELVDIAAHILSSPMQIEHNVSDTLSRPVIGVAATTAGAMNRQAPRVEKILVACAGPGRIKRRMRKQPDELAGRRVADRGGTSFHLLDRFSIVYGRFADAPLDPARLHS